MRIDYVHHCRTFDGRIWLPDLEVVLDVQLSETPDFEVDVVAVYASLYPQGEIDMQGPEATREMREIAAQIIEDAERDDDVIAEVRGHEGVVYVGFGSNDPDGRFVRRAS